ncbi:hypothetical protein G6L37_00460 [Agrobacterium rubi]|nr:hypothetical protein [Agrobacterium rubi]NTF23861.1 hypothetical protein [Agrobacterium rubi]
MSKIENTKMLEEFVASKKRGSHQVPLKETSYDIEIVSGLAVVKQTRRFRNDEKRPIEAVLSFPVAFDAVVTSLECEVAGRCLKGHAQAKKKARETYEAAIDDGKTAVLHEELLRGLHMVSVANVAPDADIVVTATYVQPLVMTSEDHEFRVPLTIGQIFGELPLQDSDQIKLGGRNADVKVSIRASSGTAYVNGALPVDGFVTVALNDVINVRVEDLAVESLFDVAADGRPVRLDFARILGARSEDANLDIDVMIDTSGSMGEAPSVRIDNHVSKFTIVEEALQLSFAALRDEDSVKVWEFNDVCSYHGGGYGPSVATFLSGIKARNKGTNLSEAVAKVVSSRRQAQILLITDGRAGAMGSRQIDVQAALAEGARITVVLVGEDALEVNVGYLASQSGGKMFVVSGSDAGSAVGAALASMRSVSSPVVPITGELSTIVREFPGAAVTATWGEEGGRKLEGVAAFAAHLAMSALDVDRAAAMAASEGIVSHLTSIVLVDAEGATLGDIPEQRKIGLPDSALGGSAMRSMSFAASDDVVIMSLAAAPSRGAGTRSAGGLRSMKAGSMPPVLAMAAGGSDDNTGSAWMELLDEAPVVPSAPTVSRGNFNLTNKGYLYGLEGLFRGLDWNSYVAELTSTPPGTLPASVAAAIIRVGSLDAFIEASDKAKVPSTSLAVGILALLFAPGDRTAQRIARKILGALPDDVVEALKLAVKAGL